MYAYALRLHLVFRLVCARNLHLREEMQWHCDSFLRRCAKVTSRSINWKMGLEEGFNVQIRHMMPSFGEAKYKIKEQQPRPQRRWLMINESHPWSPFSLLTEKLADFTQKHLKEVLHGPRSMLTSSKLHLTLTSLFKQCGSRMGLLVETFVQICTKRPSTLIKPVHRRWRRRTPLLPVSPVDGLCTIDKVKPSLIEWMDPWYCSRRLFSTLIQPAAARVCASVDQLGVPLLRGQKSYWHNMVRAMHPGEQCFLPLRSLWLFMVVWV